MSGVDCCDIQCRCGLVVKERICEGDRNKREERHEKGSCEHLAILDLVKLKEESKVKEIPKSVQPHCV